MMQRFSKISFKIKRSSLVLVLLMTAFGVNGQSVGVVLSGGGAKGLAHVGLLRALEENQIPIDYIAGTSMGAIVGSLYAIGYSPDEMEALLNSDEFRKWSLGVIDLEEKYYFKTKDENPGWIEFPFKKINDEFIAQLPTNIISPEQMDLRFMQFLEPAGAAANYDFSQLMIPYFCIATDVYKNKAVVMSSGNLSASVRASMTFPGYFKPIVIDSVLLFDGGMENNFPVDVMIEKFNPEVIIGCKVASNPEKPDSDDIYKQLENVFMKNTNYSMPENGILIAPKVKDFGLLDMEMYDTLHTLGYQATLEKMDSIKLLIQKRMDKTELAEKRAAFKEKYRPLIIENIFISGIDKESVSYILKNIRRNRELLTFEEFELEYFKLLSDKLVQSVYPRAIYNPKSGYYDMYLDIKAQNELSVSIGGNISSNLRNIGFVELDYFFQKKNIYNLSSNIYIGKFYNSINGTFRMDFPPRQVNKDKTISPFYVELSATSNRWDYFKLSTDWFVDSRSPGKVLQQDYYFRANFGRPMLIRSLFYAGFSYGRQTDEYFQTNYILKEDTADMGHFDFASIHATHEFSTLNYKEYATEGKYARFRAQYVTGQEIYHPGSTTPTEFRQNTETGHSWFRLSLSHLNFHKINRWFTLGYRTDLEYTNKSPFANSMSTMLGAITFTPFPQSKVVLLEKFRANTFAAVGILPVINFNTLLSLRSEMYLFQPYQFINTNTYKTEFSEVFPAPSLMASLALVFHTPIGPLALSGSYFNDEENPFYLQLNFGYLLFNRRGLE
jgi:NTE family protein